MTPEELEMFKFVTKKNEIKKMNDNDFKPYPEEQGLIDISAYLLPRVAFLSAKSIPVVNRFVKKYIPDPKIWNKTRKIKNKFHNNVIYGGSAAAGASGLYDYLSNR